MTILIDADGCPGVSDVMKNKTSCRTLPLILRPLERTGERDSGSQNPSTQYVASDADKIKAAKDG